MIPEQVGMLRCAADAFMFVLAGHGITHGGSPMFSPSYFYLQGMQHVICLGGLRLVLNSGAAG